MTACNATTKAGAPCRMKPTVSGYCFAHDPDREAERIAARRLGGQHRRRGTAGEPPEEVQFRSLDDLLGVLESAVADALVLDAGTQRCKTLGYLVGQGLRVIETSHLDELLARVEALERNEGAGDETRQRNQPTSQAA